MERRALAVRKAARPGHVPVLLRLLDKLVVEVLPAALASAIGAFLFAHYQFERADRLAAPALAAAPASSEMLQLVRDEHAMIREFVVAEQAAERSQIADAADARAAADAKPAIAPARRTSVALVAEKPAARHGKPIIVAAAATAGTPAATAELTPVVTAGVAQDASLTPPAPPVPAHASLVSRTLAVPGQIVGVTLHAVMAIGGIPSWIGHRVGAVELDTEALPAGTAS